MFIVLALAVLVAAGLLWLFGGKSDTDIPARIVAAAASQLPAHRRDWGRAMAAELTHIHGRAHRWQFAAGVLRVVLFPPPQRRGRALLVGAAGLMAAVAATLAAASEVPSLAVFVAVLGLLLSAYATAVTSRSPRPRPTVPRVVVGVVALAGVAAAVAAVVRIAAAHPAATTDDTHVFSILFALMLTGYLAFALTPPRLGDQANSDTVLWWALACALASGVIWTAAALTMPATTMGVISYLSPVAAAAVLAASAGASVATRSRRAGVKAGLLTGILAAPLHFALDLTTILQQHHFTLSSAYDVAAYPHSGYPDVASYILSDAVAGEIIAGLVLYPLTLLALALLGSVAGTGVHRLVTRHTTG